MTWEFWNKFYGSSRTVELFIVFTLIVNVVTTFISDMDGSFAGVLFCVLVSSALMSGAGIYFRIKALEIFKYKHYSSYMECHGGFHPLQASLKVAMDSLDGGLPVDNLEMLKEGVSLKDEGPDVYWTCRQTLRELRTPLFFNIASWLGVAFGVVACTGLIGLTL